MEKLDEFVQDVESAYETVSAVLKERRSEQDAINAFKRFVQTCIPCSISLFKEKNWKNLWRKYNERCSELIRNKETINNCYYFIDYALLIVNSPSEYEKIATCKLFCAFDTLIKRIRSHNKDAEAFKKQLDDKIINVISDGPKSADNSNNSSFKNFINELAFICYIFEKQEINLEKIEVPLSSRGKKGKTADFQLTCDDGSTCFVETITIHNTIGQDNINKFVEGKINDKYSTKTNDLAEDVINKFVILPIIEYNNDERLLDYRPVLPQEKCIAPMMPLLNEIENEYIIILEQFPLKEDIKKQLKQIK